MDRRIKVIIDICMTVLMPLLMAYSLIGEIFHEVAGTLMLALFVGHHILNRGWFRSLRKGKYTPARIYQTVLNMVLLFFMVAQPVSGILMSKHLYTFIQIRGISATAREIHLVLAYWGFVLLCLHAGGHLTAPFGKLKRSRKKLWIALTAVQSAISVYGCIAFVKRGLPDYMFGRSSFVFFDLSEPRVFFFLDYVGIMILFAFAGYLVTKGLQQINKSKSQRM